jgi:hypothetical protein
MNAAHPNDELKKDLGAALGARRDLGDDYESALVDSFLAKVDAKIDSQVERQVRRGLAEQAVDRHRRPGRRGWRGDALPYVSLVLAVPLSGIGAGSAGLTGLVVSWIGIVAVNAAHAWSPHLSGRRRDGSDGSDWEK